MSEEKFDNMIKEAMAPSYVPSEELNQRILNAKTKKKSSVSSLIPRIVAVAAAVLIVGSIGVYAGTKIYRSVSVTDHAITVGNTAYVDDETIASIAEDPSAFDEVDEGWETVSTEYDSYDEARAETGIGFGFTEEYDQIEKAIYSVTTGPDTKERELTGTFRYSRGKFYVDYTDHEGNYADDMAFSVYMENTSNIRDYTLDNGNTFTLVDDVREDATSTYVMISYDNVYGFIRFNDLTDDEIIHVLNSLDVEVIEAEIK